MMHISAPSSIGLGLVGVDFILLCLRFLLFSACRLFSGTFAITSLSSGGAVANVATTYEPANRGITTPTASTVSALS